MITLKKFDNEQILGFILDGKMDEKGMSDLLLKLKEKSKHKRVHLYGEYLHIGGLESFKAFFDTLELKFKSFSSIDKFAVVTEIGWIEKLLPVSNLLTPSIPMRLFHQNEKSVALEWLNKQVKNQFTAGIAPIELPNSTHALGYVVNGKLTGSDYKKMNEEIEELRTRQEDINLYIEILDFKGLTLKAFWEDLKLGLNHWKSFNKIAYVTSKGWLEKAAKLGDWLTPGIDVKTFKITDRRKAISWLKDPSLVV